MKISKDTIDLLKSFASVNPNFKTTGGDEIFTMSPNKNFLAKAKIKDNFPSKFSVYDLTEFLNTIALFDDPELEFGENSVEIFEGNSSETYNYCSDDLVTLKTKVNMPEIAVTVALDGKVLPKVLKASSVSKNSDVSFSGRPGKKVIVKVLNKKGNTKDNPSNVFRIELEQKAEAEFDFYFRSENFNLYPGNYKISFAKKGLAHFQNTEAPIEYWIAIESDSEFKG